MAGQDTPRRGRVRDGAAWPGTTWARRGRVRDGAAWPGRRRRSVAGYETTRRGRARVDAAWPATRRGGVAGYETERRGLTRGDDAGPGRATRRELLALQDAVPRTRSLPPMSRAPQWPRIGSRKEPLRGMIGEGRYAKSRQLLRFLGTSAPLPHLLSRLQFFDTCAPGSTPCDDRTAVRPASSRRCARVPRTRDERTPRPRDAVLRFDDGTGHGTRHRKRRDPRHRYTLQHGGALRTNEPTEHRDEADCHAGLHATASRQPDAPTAYRNVRWSGTAHDGRRTSDRHDVTRDALRRRIGEDPAGGEFVTLRRMAILIGIVATCSTVGVNPDEDLSQVQCVLCDPAEHAPPQDRASPDSPRC